MTRLTSSACLNQVSENVYASFFPPLLSSLLNPGAVGVATRDKSTSNMVQGKYLHSDSEISRAGKRLLEQAAPISVPCQCFSLPVAAGSAAAGRETLGSPRSIPAWALWSLHCHPSHGEGSLGDCTLQDVVWNVKFEVQGFPSLVPGTGAQRQGLILVNNSRTKFCPISHS